MIEQLTAAKSTVLRFDRFRILQWARFSLQQEDDLVVTSRGRSGANFMEQLMISFLLTLSAIKSAAF